MLPLMSNGRDPDDQIVPLWRHLTLPNKKKSDEEGRPICEDVEVVDLKVPGKKDFGTHRAFDFSHWTIDPETGGQVQVTYAERFARQYRQFKEKAAQTKVGTPCNQVPFLTPARCAEMRALNIYTIEQLAAVDGQELKNLGPGGRDDKNRAAEYLVESKTSAPSLRLQSELDAERARNQVLEQDLAIFRTRAATAEAQFEEMTDEQLIAHIKSITGFAPQGSLPRKTLVRLAIDNTPPNRAA